MCASYDEQERGVRFASVFYGQMTNGTICGDHRLDGVLIEERLLKLGAKTQTFQNDERHIPHMTRSRCQLKTARVELSQKHHEERGERERGEATSGIQQLRPAFTHTRFITTGRSQMLPQRS